MSFSITASQLASLGPLASLTERSAPVLKITHSKSKNPHHRDAVSMKLASPSPETMHCLGRMIIGAAYKEW